MKTGKRMTLLLVFSMAVFYYTQAQFKVVGYMPSWAGSASSIQYSKLTHINYAFALPNSDGSLKPLDNPAKLQSIVSTAHSQGKKVLIAVGGWSDGGEVLDGRFEILAANPTSRTRLVNDLMNLVASYGLDGVDVDWEYPDAGASANNYLALLTELSNRLHASGKLLSVALPADQYNTNGVLPGVFNVIDYLNIMAYDGAGANHSTYAFAQSALNLWKGKGLPQSKAILGVPFYARPSWNSFATLLSLGANPNADFFGSDGYNGIPTIKSKTTLALQQGGGIMIWELSQDATGANSLLSAIDQVVKAGNPGNVAPAVSIASPANGASYTAPASIVINVNASDTDGSVSKVEFFNGSAKLGEDLTAPYSFTWSNVGAGSYSLTARATDNAGAAATSGAVSISVSNPVTQSPYGGTARNIPGKIEAEHYDLGGQNVAFNDLTAGNTGAALRTEDVDLEATTDVGGGHNVGWIQAGEWLEYTVSVTAGTYSIAARVASTSAGKTFHLEMDGINVSGAITVPNTGGWQTWQTVTITNKSLSGGQKVMRIVADAGDFNLNFVQFTSGSTSNQSPSVSLTSPTQGTTFTAPATLTLNATASDADGSVSKVEFFNGSIKLGEDLSAPYSFTWSGVAAGSYALSAKAIDNAGAVSTSAVVTITVNTGGGTCSTPAWNAASTYATAGQRVSRSGNVYENKWWTQGQDPLTNSGTWDVWKLIGPCNARISLNGMMGAENSISTSPNPTLGSLLVDFTLTDASELTAIIYDGYGQQVYRQTGITRGTELSLYHLPAGVYMLQWQVNGETLIQRLIKE